MLPNVIAHSQNSIVIKGESTDESINSNGKYTTWQNVSESDSQPLTDYPSVDSSEEPDIAPDENESPYLAQVPDKPAFVLKRPNHQALATCSSFSPGPVFKEGLIFNQSYQSKKVRLTSVESPPDNYSNFSSPPGNEPESVFEAELLEPYVYNDDLYLEEEV